MAKHLKKYLIDDNGSDVFAISLVDEPAIEESFIALSKEKPQYISLSEEERHMIYGPVLVPDKPIYRIDEYTGEEYYIQFSAPVINKLAQKFLKYGGGYFTTDHMEYANELFCVESWIKEDMDIDKSVALGLNKDLPVGTWLVGCKVNNVDVWDRVKNGDFSGYSVEAFVNFGEEVDFSKIQIEKMENKDNNIELLSAIKNIILEALGKGEKVEETPIEEEVKLEETTETAVTEEVKEVVESVVEKVEEAVEETVEPEATEEEVIEEKANELQAVVDALQAEVDSLKAENEELKKENQKLSKQPSAKKVNVEASKQSNGIDFMDFATGKIRY